MIVRKGAEGEGSRYQVIYRRTSYPILQNVHIAILSTICRAIRNRRARQKRNTDRHRHPPPNSLPNPLPPPPAALQHLHIDKYVFLLNHRHRVAYYQGYNNPTGKHRYAGEEFHHFLCVHNTCRCYYDNRDRHPRKIRTQRNK